MNLNNFIVLYKEPWLFEYGKQCDTLAQERPPAPKIGCTPWIDMHEVICVRLRPGVYCNVFKLCPFTDWQCYRSELRTFMTFWCPYRYILPHSVGLPEEQHEKNR